jgi:hypothetical protein
MSSPSTGPLALTERQLAAALGTLAEAVTVQAADGRILFANAAAVAMLGFAGVEEMLAADPAELIGRYRVFHPDGSPLHVDELPGRQVLHGRHPAPQLMRWIAGDSGMLGWSVVKATPLLDDDGALVGAVNVIEDVTEAAEADMSRRLLDEAARTLASSLDYEQTLQHVARLAVPTLADWCAVDLLDERGEIVQVAVAHIDPERVRFAREFRRRYPIDPEQEDGLPGVIRSGVTSLTQDVTDEMLVAAARDEEHLALLRALGLRAALLVPLVAAGRVIGALTLVLAQSARRFTPGDVALAEELGRRAGAAVQNARLYTERGRIAHVLQASMLPGELPEMDGWVAALHHRAAGEANEVGGDLYDIQEAGEDRWLALVGDVVGKGAGAAALTPRVRHTIAAAAALTGDPRDGLALLDRALEAEADPERATCTVAAALLSGPDDEAGARARVVCAGHPRPLLVRDGRVTEVGMTGPMLGVAHAAGDRPFEDVAMRAGDVLVLYTDGITEAPGAGDRFGAQRLCAALEGAGPGARAQELVAAACAALEAFGDGPPQDDVVLLALERTRP